MVCRDLSGWGGLIDFLTIYPFRPSQLRITLPWRIEVRVSTSSGDEMAVVSDRESEESQFV